MKWIKTCRCDSWGDFKSDLFKQLFSDGRFSKGKYWFRGHSCSQHKLESSFDRWYNKLGAPTLKRTQLGNDLFRAFKEEVAWCEGFENILADDAKALALGRHYGLPTRQLDWSESPYIAAFFAFSGCSLTDCGSGETAIWALNLESRVWGADQGVVLEMIDRSGNPRLKIQSGGFTLLRTPSSCLEDHVEGFALEKDDLPAMWKFLLPDGFAKEALADLDSMGIHPFSVFGGVEGAALAAQMRVTLGLADFKPRHASST